MRILRSLRNRRSPSQRRHPVTPSRRQFLRRGAASVFWAASGSLLRAAEPTSEPSLPAESPSKPLPPMTGQDVPELEGFDQLMRGFIVEQSVPGAAVAISRGNRLIYARGFGLADREAAKSVEPDALFRLASCTKPFTATAVMQLVDRQLLRLDDRIWNVLQLSEPRWNGARFDPRWKDITLLELLQHRGGWDREKSFDPISRMHDISQKLGVRLPITPEHILQYMLGFPFDFPPGERYAYSNFGFILLGLAIQRITGRGYEEFVRREVLAAFGDSQDATRPCAPRTAGRGRSQIL